MAQGSLRNLILSEAGRGKNGNKPAGISDEWFKKVCQSCDKLTPTAAAISHREVPRQMRPIIRYEMKSTVSERRRGRVLNSLKDFRENVYLLSSR